MAENITQPSEQTERKNVWRRTSDKVGSARSRAARWTRRTIAGLFALVIIAAVIVLAVTVYNVFRSDPSADLDVSTTLTCPDCELLLVTGVIDGNTLDTNLGTVRLYGARTPALGEDCHTKSVEATRELAGSVVRAQAGPELTDPFDRRLYYLYTESGRSIDEVLIRNGLAYANVDPAPHRDHLLSVERESAADDRGCLWS